MPARTAIFFLPLVSANFPQIGPMRAATKSMMKIPALSKESAALPGLPARKGIEEEKVSPWYILLIPETY